MQIPTIYSNHIVSVHNMTNNALLRWKSLKITIDWLLVWSLPKYGYFWWSLPIVLFNHAPWLETRLALPYWGTWVKPHASSDERRWKIFHDFGRYGCNTNLCFFVLELIFKKTQRLKSKWGTIFTNFEDEHSSKIFEYHHLGLVWFGVEHPTPIHPEIEA